ncbi:MAG: lytic murein transglycosylase [Nitrospiraceae bacterium]|nr:MAG: lytic murein transglycosylase [Nitrospiraceae bacterium]
MTDKQIRQLAVLFIAVFLLFVPSVSSSLDSDFAVWLEELKAEARAKGISDETLDFALTGLQPIPRVIKLDRNQPELKQDFQSYLNMRISEDRIKQGRKLLMEHRELLEKIKDRYGVPPRYLVAIWGLETSFGKYLGDFPVIGSLATLAYDERRSDFFRAELINALTIVDEGHIKAADMLGSWAGAMGQVQFMPSTFVLYATDADKDGRKDIWNSYPDIFESAANYLAKSGWERGFIWGRQVMLPPGINFKLAGLDTEKTLSEWQGMGLRRINGNNLPEGDIKASLILPDGNDAPAFLVYPNYRVIMKWNRSHHYAITVGHLADRIIGKAPLTLR